MLLTMTFIELVFDAHNCVYLAATLSIVVINLPSYWLAEPCPNDAYVDCRGVSLHKDQLLQDPLTFNQNSSYELFWFLPRDAYA